MRCKCESAPVICRKSSTLLPLALLAESINKFDEKKIDFTNLSILNGIPNSELEAIDQQFPPEALGLYQELREKINATIDSKVNKFIRQSAKYISNKQSLIHELTNGNEDILFIFAHSDGNSIYFGNESISIEELSLLPQRENKKHHRVAILFSCSTANIFSLKPKWYHFFKKANKSFAEILIEKRFFDLVIAPSSIINGEEILKMVGELDKFDILELRNRLQSLAGESDIYNIAEN